MTVLSVIQLSAQNIEDALRYGQDNLSGTARFTALSGAFGALGGDISAFNINPAGSSIFLYNNATISLTVDDVDNVSLLSGTQAGASDVDFTIGNAGAVYVFEHTNENAKWKKFSIGISYHSQNNFENELFISGSTSNTIGRFFVEQANGVPLELLQTLEGESISSLYAFLGETEGVRAQNAFLGFQGFVIDPAQGSNNQYISNTGTGRFNKDFLLASDGLQGKYTFNFSGQYSDNWFFGINLNGHTVDYRQASFLRETNNNSNSSTKRVGFENNLSTIGSGFSAQFGIITKIKENMRLGISYDTPTWYILNEETIQYLDSSRLEDGNTINTVVDPNIINVFADYRLTTPGKLTASAAYIFGKNGLLSFDYSYQDFSTLKLRPTSDPFFNSVNNNIENVLGGVSTYRLGGEYRIGLISLRGGMHLEESPYKDDFVIGDRSGFSGGIGVNLGNYFLDFAYTRSEQEFNQDYYNLGLVDVANINTTQQQFIFSLGLNL